MIYKLRNTFTELKIRERIIQSTIDFYADFNRDNKSKIINLINKHIAEIKSFYVLDWCDCGQGDYRFYIFVNKEWIITIELDDDEIEPPLFEIKKIYTPSEAGLSVLIALELEKEGLKFP